LLKTKISSIFAISLSLATISSIGVYADYSPIPDWVKNNAKWWAEGQIQESDYISSLQYLINQGILQIPIKTVTATTTNLSSDDIAESFVVNFHGGDYFTQDITIYTYSRFFHFSETVTSDSVSNFQDKPGFVLRSLPSKDKAPIYDLVNLYVSAGAPPEMFDVSVKILSGDGSMIQTWEYRRCDVVDYATYVDDDKDEYRFGNEDKSEIRDALVMECGGFSLKTP
jgi:hypothetical protein